MKLLLEVEAALKDGLSKAFEGATVESVPPLHESHHQSFVLLNITGDAEEVRKRLEKVLAGNKRFARLTGGDDSPHAVGMRHSI
ncbi:hypothetical protein FJZ28_01705 [Candidatus Peregrinibacteria bacterium]|nr:hypothetical protein [Candidatus Peregrinibacteria bacterium]